MVTDGHHAHTIRHFGPLADRYDQRWQRYIRRTLEQAVEALQIPGNGTVLDVGCGTGEFERLARQRFAQALLVGVDVTPQMVAVACEKFHGSSGTAFLVAQAETLPFPASRFDAVVSCSMLHHLQAPEGLLRECARVLRPQGRLVIVDWCRDFPHCRLAHYWLRLTKRSYVTMYRAADLIERAAPLGLAVEGVSRFFVPPYFGMMRVVATKQQAP